MVSIDKKQKMMKAACGGLKENGRLPDCFLVATLLLLKMVDGVGDMTQQLGTLAISGFNSQNPHDSLQLPETPIPGDSVPCSDLHGHNTSTQYTDIYAEIGV